MDRWKYLFRNYFFHHVSASELIVYIYREREFTGFSMLNGLETVGTSGNPPRVTNPNPNPNPNQP